MKAKQILKKIIPSTIRKNLRKIQEALKSLIHCPLFYLLKPFAFVSRKISKQKIYIFAERGIDAGDNGYFIYKHFKSKGHKCFYIIDKKCKDASKIDKNDIISPKTSLKHYYLFQKASYFIYTHHWWYLPIVIRENSYFKLYGKKIFLQHGVIDKKITYFHFDMFITSSPFEQKYVMEQTGCNEKQITLTGLARFDDLYEHSGDKKIILLMPTWRKWLNNRSKKEMVESEYYKKWMSLCHNKVLLEYCREKGYRIIFYPHFEMCKVLGLENFVLTGDEANYSVHDLLLNCSILVTDYSSVAFDVAYQHKSVIYYQFDNEKFFKEHYDRAYFDHKNGLGYYAEDEDEVINQIINASIRGIDETIKTRIDNFFFKIDNHNCDRIYQAIMELK